MKSGEYFARAVVALGLSIGLAFVATPAAQAAIAPAAAPVSAHASTSVSSVRPAVAGPLAARVAPSATAGLVCATGTFYAVSGSGQLQRVSNGNVTNVGSLAPGVSSFNGLGIGANGATALAYERTNNSRTATIWYFDGSAWKSTGDSYTTAASLVAGAVDLKTGDFFFGGFANNSFYIYRYVPGTGAFSLVGTIDTSSAGGTNGDMAFDASGNLYVAGSATTTSVYSVTAASIAGGTGGQLPASQSFSFAPSGFSGINGMAFNTTGSMYLGNGNTVREYNASTGAQIGGNVTSNLSSTDLASCNSPANLTVKKNVVARAHAGDQFRLSVKSGTTESGTATTSGASNGVQVAQVGPLPVLQNGVYTVSETIAAGSPGTLADYASSTVCVDDTGATVPTNASGQLTIPNRSGASVECTITNSPLLATVAVHKTVLDINGNNPAPGAGWTLGAATTATAGSATSTPSATTQTTPASGDVNWTVAFDKQTSRATVRVSETQKSGWDFVSGSCVVTPLAGSPRTVTLPGATGADVTGVAPGDAVACTITNKPSSAALTLKKQVDNTYGGGSVVSDWTLTATGAQAITGKTGDPSVTGAVVAPGTYALTESGSPAGYAAGAWTCTGATVSGSSVTVAANANAVCTITNASKPGSVVWTKTSKTTGGQLAGSEWTLTGPGLPAQGVVVKDCTTAPCAGPDQDPAPGAFRLDKLAWGTYTAKETLAPAGYIAAGSFTFTVNAANAGTTLNIGAQQNEQQAGAVLPLTGGLGSDAFLLGGGALLFSALSVLGVLRLRRNARRAS
ncbi:SpaA isopeptide-forming pilin-related protein [Microbacterium sp. NPDC089698]|uniref:SpaA isopeptide-forming pilin-related protein n=1 Tax=Microbacterium sp. NPDC089698 TaxID=3364200 RepID=UPI0037F5569A